MKRAGLRALQTLSAMGASTPRRAPRAYEEFNSCDLLKAHRLAASMTDSDAVLDVGCALGLRLREVGLFRPALRRRVGVDLVVPASPPGIELVAFDGWSLPFADGEFDVTMICYVLHHLTRDHARRLVGEALRVTSRRLILLEDSLPAFGLLYRIRNRLHRIESDIDYRAQSSRYRHIRSERMFLTHEEWRSFLEPLPRVGGVRVHSLASISRLPHHTLFEIEVRRDTGAASG
jgi:SAM-dependent methyltransferase